jgi:hypothetical protein
MRWFRRKSASKSLTVDPARQAALIADIRQRFGGHAPGRFREQAQSLADLLGGDEGLTVAGRIVHETAERAHADVQAQTAALRHRVDRRNYRALFRQTGLQYRFTEQSSGWHPYIHLGAALDAIEGDVKRAMVLTDPNWLLVHTLELLDLTVSGWEFGRVPVSTDAADLVIRLIATATRMRLTEDEPPALPPGIRDVMRSNRATNVHDQAGAVVGVLNVGAETRRSFLI